MRRHRKFALWMGVIMAVSAVTSEVPDDICEVVKAVENTVSMTDFTSSGEAAGTITISTGEELTLFAEYVNAGNSTKGRSFCLTSDITLNEASYQYQDASKRTGIYCDEELIGAVDQSGNCYENLETSQTTDPGSLSRVILWTAVGTKEYPFQGSFDGKDHTIRGLCVIGNESDPGLFGCVGSNGSVCSLTLEKALVTGRTGVGAIVGNQQGMLSDVISRANIVMSSGCIGGAVGENSGSIVNTTAQDVVVIGRKNTLTTERDEMDRINGIGGIVGRHTAGELTGCSLRGEESRIPYGGGGIVGYVDGGNITSCANYSDLRSSGGDLGGIVDFVFQGYLRDCNNYGNLELTYHSESSINLAGIVAGTFSSNWNDIVIDGCFNYGDVLQKEREDAVDGNCMDSIGGISGRHGGGVIGNCGNYGTVGVITQKNDLSYARIGGAYGFLQVGGIVAGLDGASRVINCYNIGDIEGDIFYAGGIAGRKNMTSVEGCYTVGEIRQLLGKGQICGYIDGGSLTRCYYWKGTNRTVYSRATELNEYYVTGCEGVSLSAARSSLIDKLNDFVEYRQGYQYSELCPLRSWVTGPNGYPVFGTEGEMACPVVSPKADPYETQKPVISLQPTGEPGVSNGPTQDPSVSAVPSEVSQPADGSSTQQPAAIGSTVPESPLSTVWAQSPSPSAAVTENINVSLRLKVSQELSCVSGVNVSLQQIQKVSLRWKKVSGVDGYGIYRREGRNGALKRLGTVTGKTSYLDATVRKGKKYQYQIFAFGARDGEAVRSRAVTSERIRIPDYAAPTVSYATEITPGKNYLKIKLKKYKGQYLEIWMKKNGIVQTTTLHPISKYNGVFRLSYTKRKGSVYCKVRTWEIKNGKKKYSAYTELKRIRL